MADFVYKQIELTGTSKTNIEDAIQNAIAKAAKTIHHIQWFQVIEVRGSVEANKVAYWQVIMKVGFKLED
ncbi:MAG: dodecin [Terriglobia bacterium]